MGTETFATTQWSLVFAAGSPSDPQRSEALEAFCRIYWFPLYAFARRQGHDAHSAQDLIQGFLARWLERNDFAGVVPTETRFRSYLLKALRHYLINEHHRNQALKRGGHQQFFSIDEDSAESRLALNLASGESPDLVFDREWALALLGSALHALGEEQVRLGKGAWWEAVKHLLSQEPAEGEYARIAASLGLSQGAVGVGVHRLRERYQAMVRQAVAATVEGPLEVDAEIRHLRQVIAHLHR